MARLASPHLPHLHPCAFILFFSLCDQSPLPELSFPIAYSQARSHARGSQGPLCEGRWSPVPPNWGSAGSTGAPRSEPAMHSTPLSSASCRAALPQKPLVSPADRGTTSCPAAAPHGSPGTWQVAAQARGKAFGSGEALPCCRAAVVHPQEEQHRRSDLSARRNNFPVQTCPLAELFKGAGLHAGRAPPGRAACGMLLASRRCQMTQRFSFIYLFFTDLLYFTLLAALANPTLGCRHG